MKRHHIVIVIILSLLLPQVATAVLRPENAEQTEPESKACRADGLCDFVILAADQTGVESPNLVTDRWYRFEVTGVWRPDINSTTHKADAACSSADGVNWGKTGLGLIIHATNYGSPSNSTACRSDHKYSFNVQGRGTSVVMRIADTNYSDNADSLLVKVWTVNKVSYTGTITQPINLIKPATPEAGRFDFSTQTIADQPVSQTVTVGQNPGVISPVTTPPLDLPGPFGKVEIRFTQGTGFCSAGKFFSLYIEVMGEVIIPREINGQETPQPVCIPASGGNVFQTTGTSIGGRQESRNLSSTVTVTSFAGLNTCSYLHNATQLVNNQFSLQNPLYLQGIGPPTLLTIGPIGDSQGGCKFTLVKESPEGPLLPLIPPGSTMNVLLTWKAETARLWKTAANDRNPNTGEEHSSLWAPFHFSDHAWFTGEVAALRLAASIGFFIETPQGPIGLGEIVRIPGLGQLLEAMFHSQFNCNNANTPEGTNFC